MTTPLVSTSPAAADIVVDGPWYRQVTREQWRAFWAVFLGWIVDSFDFNIMTFILIDIMNDFSVDRAAAGALGTVTLIMRLVGGSIAGTAADKWGRKLPLTLSILWFSLFAFLSGFSTSYAMLFGLRALFGLGMGGEWAAGMPLVFEHWPTRLRGLVSGLMLGGWYWGLLLAAATFQFVYPALSKESGIAWRAMFCVALVPALFTLWIRSRVSESPVWVEQQRLKALRGDRGRSEPQISLVRLFQPDLIGITLQTTTVISAFMCIYYSVIFWYPTFLRLAGRPTLPYLAALAVGAISGTATFGRLSETALGRRGAVTITVILGIASIPFFMFAQQTPTLLLGAFMMGFFGMGVWGMAPAYTVERFPADVRGAGPGFCYHAGAAIGALMPWLLGKVQDQGVNLVVAMTVSMVVSGVLAVAAIWSGPETRGRAFVAE